VRIEQRGRGAQAEAQGIGWLSRFFINVLPIWAIASRRRIAA